jgi:acyl transferase domain-containing protein/NAD(P)-dependent dehydrogenase (short-subunit alcohol dehydrogenase family)/acyl carrier protein
VSSTPTRLGDLSAVKLALMAKKVRVESQAVLRADPIAVVGMACRVPGGDTLDQFWQLIRSGGDAIREVPPDRWNADRWFDPDPAASAKASTKWGGFIDRIDGFDAGYFGILPREAERMDPQQRVFLEVAVEAFDHAGLPRERLRGSRAGVFVASYHNDYAFLQYGDLDAIDARTLTGTLHSVLANRLSYFLDLRGPSISIDTACSSSLVAIHLACQSLRFGESDVAIAGGVSLMITPELTISMSKVGFMAPDGHCRTFDARASGFGRGEGCGVVVCKRLSDAIADGDRILAVLRGSAVNQDGHSTLLAAPNGLAQQAMINEALSSAQMAPGRIGLVEAHGTGTALGDPIEVEALAATIGVQTSGASPCFLGAVKANLGHLEAAAGVVGLIKAILSLRHQEVPPQANFTQLSPHISLEGTRLTIPTTLTPWPSGDLPRCAAVSSFGVGGTNAHVIVEEEPDLPGDPLIVPDVPRVLPLSAQSPDALRALVQAWDGFLGETSASVTDICYTASERRSHFEHRVAVLGRSKAEYKARLAEWLSSDQSLASMQGRGEAGPRVGFVFSGQGPQWYAMGRELLAEEPVFRAVLTECDALLRPLSRWSLLEELAAPEDVSRLGQTEVAQPALFALQVGLAALWKSWGLLPDGVVGHSVGEIAALHVAGALTLADAVRVVWHRGHVMQQATGLGRMCAVSMTAAEARELVSVYGERLSVGAFNGPRSVVLSGGTAAMEEALATLIAGGVSHRMLPVDYAFHSAQMEPFQQLLIDQLTDVRLQAPALAMYSTVTGARVSTDERVDRAYFARNMREPVRFSEAITAMAEDGFDAFVEIGPHPVLGAVINECLEAAGHSALVVASLRRQRSERHAMLEASAGLYVAGWTPVWEAFQQAAGEVTTLPRYPWQRKRFWIRPRPEAVAVSSLPETGHLLLGRRVPAAGIEAQIFEGSSGGAEHWCSDHRVFGRLIMPGAAVLETLLAGAKTVLGPECQLTGFAMHRPLFIPEPGSGVARWQTVVTFTEPGHADVDLYEAVFEAGDLSDQWRRVASAAAEPRELLRSVAGVGRAATERVESGDVYERFEALGVAFGPTFQCLGAIRRGDGVAEGWIDLPVDLHTDASLHVLHPVLLDAGLQLCSLAAQRGPAGDLPAEVMLPLGADRFDVLRTAPTRLLAWARVREGGQGGSLSADVTFGTGENGGTIVAFIDGMRFARAEPGAFEGRDQRDQSDEALYEVAWHKVATDPARSSGRRQGRWLIFCDGSGLGDRVVRELAMAGAQCSRVQPGDRFARTSPETFTVHPADPRDFQKLLDEARSPGVPLEGVVHLWSLDVEPLLGHNEVGADQEDLLTTGSLLHLVQSLAIEACPLWVVTRGAHVVSGEEPQAGLRPRAAGVWGLASVIALEHSELQVRRVDLDPAAEDDDEGLLVELLTADHALEASRSLALRRGEWWAPRLESCEPHALEPADERPWRVEVCRPGTFDGVDLRPTERVQLRQGEVRLRVLASGINFRDVLMTLGMYPGPSAPLGFECVGVVTEVHADTEGLEVGARAFGYAPASLGTEVVVPAAFLAPVPANLSAEEAASIPVAFLTAYYGLHRLAHLQPGERVLIHAAAGGVGLAAIQLALNCGAEVFATAGSPEKRALLRSMGAKHVMDSRSLLFADEIRAATAGEGVHVVLNSLAGDFIAASLSIVKFGGVFLELGKRGVLTPEAAARTRPDVRYCLYDLGAEAHADHGLLRPMFDELLAGLQRGVLRPLPVTVYPLGEVREAFRFMAQGKHVGKIVMRPPAAITGDGPLVSGAASYWITGGFGGLGLETARWLVRSGARTVVLSGRRPPSPTAVETIAELESQGAVVRIFAVDAADPVAMRAIVEEIRDELPPLRGVIHAAGVADDSVLLHQTWERCRGVLRGKAHGAWVLHELTRALPLDFFVLYSAAGTLLGAQGQGAYPAANAELDALAHARHRLGLPALSVAWGAWSDVGMMAALAARGPDVWAARGLGKITPALGFARLERLLREGATAVAVMPIDWRVFLAQLSRGADRSFFKAMEEKIRFAHAPQNLRVSTIVPHLQALPAGQRRQALVAHLAERALQVLGLDASTPVNTRLPLKELGLDSLMAVELRNELARSMGQPLPATLLFDYPTVDTLADHLMRTLIRDTDDERGSPSSRQGPGAIAVETSVVAGLSDEEAESLLLKEIESGSPRRAHVGAGHEY